MKFQGGWITASYKRACSRSAAPEGYHLFRYKDKGTECIAHMLDLQNYGVTKKWVIIAMLNDNESFEVPCKLCLMRTDK